LNEKKEVDDCCFQIIAELFRNESLQGLIKPVVDIERLWATLMERKRNFIESSSAVAVML
jgi:hypothetical protein